MWEFISFGISIPRPYIKLFSRYVSCSVFSNSFIIDTGFNDYDPSVSLILKRHDRAEQRAKMIQFQMIHLKHSNIFNLLEHLNVSEQWVDSVKSYLESFTPLHTPSLFWGSCYNNWLFFSEIDLTIWIKWCTF